MLQFFAIVLTVFLLGWIPYASADHHEQKDTQTQGVDKMSEEGAENTNSPASGDQMKGEDRADERHSMEHGSDSTSTDPKADSGHGKKKSK
jgi:hypothetical protein